MTAVDRAYIAGMSSALEHNGFSKQAAQKLSSTITALEKKAALFNFSDSMSNDGHGISLSNVLIPLLAAGAAGYVAYNARDKGYGNRSALENIKNYIAGGLNKITRRSAPRPMYDIMHYIND